MHDSPEYQPLEDPELAPTVESVLNELNLDLHEMARLRAHCQELVDQARQLGATWEQIGQATGTGRSTAYERWTTQGRQNSAERQHRFRAREEPTQD